LKEPSFLKTITVVGLGARQAIEQVSKRRMKLFELQRELAGLAFVGIADDVKFFVVRLITFFCLCGSHVEQPHASNKERCCET